MHQHHSFSQRRRIRHHCYRCPNNFPLPHHQPSHKPRAEIAAASVSVPTTDAEARKLPYLEAVIKEGLRIWPPVVGLMAKEVPPGGDEIHGIFVSGGTSIGYCAFGIFRDKKIWGEDVDVFRPERFLEGEPEKIRHLEQLVFAQGKWQCLGQKVALIELNKVFVEVRIHTLSPFSLLTFFR